MSDVSKHGCRKVADNDGRYIQLRKINKNLNK